MLHEEKQLWQHLPSQAALRELEWLTKQEKKQYFIGLSFSLSSQAVQHKHLSSSHPH